MTKWTAILFATLFVVTFSASVCEAGGRGSLISLSNYTTTGTTSESLKYVDKWDARVVMNNFSGTVAIDQSWDDGTTWVNRTTVSTGGGSFNIQSYSYAIPTNIRVVVTDSFMNTTGLERPAHVTPNLELDMNYVPY